MWHSANNASSFIKHLILRYFDTDQNVLITNTDGVWQKTGVLFQKFDCSLHFLTVWNQWVFCRFYTTPIYEAFQDGSYIDFARNEIKSIHEALFAIDAPSAYVPVVLKGGTCSGTLFHEACGHQLETSGFADGSLFKDKIGAKIASNKVTLIEDETLPGMYGSSRFDDEGMPRQKSILIENGILKSYLFDRLGARTYHVYRTGSGRRQNYCFAPSVRTSHTYLTPGMINDDKC